MKLAARIATAAALVAFAVPALACNETKSTNATASQSKPAVAKAEKKASKATPAQSENKKN